MSNLEAIDWQSLKTCYGYGAEIPEWLKQLASPESAVRKDAIEKLTTQIYHQGSIYEATPYVVPFLVALLSDSSVRDKEDLLGLLWLLMLGQPLADDELLRSLLEQEGRDFDREMALSKSYVKNTVEGIRLGLPVYFALLSDENPKIRMWSAHLLSVFSQDTQETAPRLLSQVGKETDDNVKATAIWALGLLLADSREELSRERIQYMELLARLIASAEGLLVRFTSSAFQLKMAGNEAPEEAAELLVDAASRPERYPRLPWGDVVQWTACEALAELHENKRVATFERLLAESHDPGAAHDIVIIFLNRVFRGRDARMLEDFGIGFDRTEDGTKVRHYSTNYEVKPIQRLSREQRAILTAVSNSEKFWEIHNNLLETYGLPGSREGLRKFLASVAD